MARNYDQFWMTTHAVYEFASEFTGVNYIDSSGETQAMTENSYDYPYVKAAPNDPLDGFFRRRLFIDGHNKVLIWADDSFGGVADNVGVARGSIRMTDSQWAFKMPREKLKFISINALGGVLGIHLLTTAGDEIALSLTHGCQFVYSYNFPTTSFVCTEDSQVIQTPYAGGALNGIALTVADNMLAKKEVDIFMGTFQG